MPLRILAELTNIAANKALKSVKPRAIEPGRYTVVFEPTAVGNLVQFITRAFNARSAATVRGAHGAIMAEVQVEDAKPLEVMVELANQTGTEPWFNMPAGASEAASSGCSTLMATARSCLMSCARNTADMPPRPSSRSTV